MLPLYSVATAVGVIATVVKLEPPLVLYLRLTDATPERASTTLHFTLYGPTVLSVLAGMVRDVKVGPVVSSAGSISTSSMDQPEYCTLGSLPKCQRSITVCPRYAVRFTVAFCHTCWPWPLKQGSLAMPALVERAVAV